MKKFTVMLFIFLSGSIVAQPYVNIPDPAFRNVLDSVAPGCIVGLNLNTTHPGLANVTNLTISYQGISDLTGIEYLSNLASIDCSHNQIFFVPTLPNSLYGLYIGHNQLSDFPIIPSTVANVKIDYNNLGLISAIPPSVTMLDVSGCNLTTLPSLPSQMISLQCENNNLTSLPTLPANLEFLQCINNSLASLPALPNSLFNLLAAGNGLLCIPNLPTNPFFTSDIGYIICGSQGTPDSWYPQTAVPVNSMTMATCFSIGAKCYLGNGSSSPAGTFFWEFNTATNTWTQKMNTPGPARLEPVGFNVGNKGYFGMGQGGSPANNNDIWEYDPVTNNWTQRASYPGSGYMGMASFVIGDKAFVGLGIGLNYTFPVNFYQFDPAANTWSSITNFPGLGRREAACFTIGNKGYVCAGDGANSLLANCYSFNVATGAWTTIAPTPSNLNEAASFSINGKGYIAGGQYDFWNGPRSNNLLQYDPVSNTWSSKASLPTPGRQLTTGCAAGSKGYVGTGVLTSTGGGSVQTNDWWEYTPTCYTPSTQIYASENGTCTGDSIMLYADPGNNYQWKRNGSNIAGATKNFVYVTLGGNYTCAISNACGSVTSITQNIVINGPVTATVTPAGSTTFCAGGSVSLNANTGAGLTYQWKKYGNSIPGATSSSYVATTAGSYKVVVTNAGGCSTSSSAVTVTINALPVSSITANGTTTFCPGGSVLLTANTGTGLTYQWKKGSNILSGATASTYSATTAGTYKVIVTNAKGCAKTSNGITITILPTPAANITAGGPTTFCTGDSVVLSANSGSGLSYHWKKGSSLLAGATSINYAAKITGNFKCVVTNANGCTKTSNTIPVSVPCREANVTNEEPGFVVYPNPSQDLFHISGVIDKDQLTIRNIHGQTIQVNFIESGEDELIIDDLAPGIYFLFRDNEPKKQPVKIIRLH